jgi:hypothetical protein
VEPAVFPFRETPSNGPRVGAHAYRASTVRGVCTLCGELTSIHSCPRCDAPLCDLHLVSHEERCPVCEETFLSLEEHRKAHPLRGYQLALCYVLAVVVVAVAVPLLQGWLLLGSRSWLAATLGITFLAALLPLWAALLRRRRLRRGFLRERPGKRRIKLDHLQQDRAPSPREPMDEIAVAALTLAPFFFLPFVSQIGVLMGIGAAVRLRHRRKERGWRAAILATVVGTAATLLQIVLLASARFL